MALKASDNTFEIKIKQQEQVNTALLLVIDDSQKSLEQCELDKQTIIYDLYEAQYLHSAFDRDMEERVEHDFHEQVELLTDAYKLELNSSIKDLES